MKYNIYYKEKKLDLKYCGSVSLDISTPAVFENAGIDMSKLNNILNSGIDNFNKSSEFFNDICSTFFSENGTDVPIKDRHFSLNMIYPFGICIFTALLRRISLYYRYKFLFQCSKILQLI